MEFMVSDCRFVLAMRDGRGLLIVCGELGAHRSSGSRSCCKTVCGHVCGVGRVIHPRVFTNRGDLLSLLRIKRNKSTLFR